MYIQNLPFYIAVILKSNLFLKKLKKMIGLKNVRLFIVIYDVCMHHLFFTLNKINLLFKRIRRIFSWPILHRYDCFARKVVEASINKCYNDDEIYYLRYTCTSKTFGQLLEFAIYEF